MQVDLPFIIRGDKVIEQTMESFMGIPMILREEVLGMAGFADKEGGFSSEDTDAAQMLVVALVEALSLKKQQDEKSRLEEMIVQSEKMVSLGGLAAGMAHEINNPLAGMIQSAQVIHNRLTMDLPIRRKGSNIASVTLMGFSTMSTTRAFSSTPLASLNMPHLFTRRLPLLPEVTGTASS